MVGHLVTAITIRGAFFGASSSCSCCIPRGLRGYVGYNAGIGIPFNENGILQDNVILDIFDNVGSRLGRVRSTSSGVVPLSRRVVRLTL